MVHIEQVLDMLQAFSSDGRFKVIKDRYKELEDKEACNKMCLLLDMCEESGIEKGIEKLADLLNQLKAEEREEDMNRVLLDASYREDLFREFNL